MACQMTPKQHRRAAHGMVAGIIEKILAQDANDPVTFNLEALTWKGGPAEEDDKRAVHAELRTIVLQHRCEQKA